MWVHNHFEWLWRLGLTCASQYYISQAIDDNDLKGLAAFLLASLEFEML